MARKKTAPQSTERAPTGVPPPRKPRRSPRPRSAWTDKTPAERTAALLDMHTKTVAKARAEAAAKGCPDQWKVNTSWETSFDAPFSSVLVGEPDPTALDALAEFLVDAWLDRRKRNEAARG
jgi:hypothetical protein